MLDVYKRHAQQLELLIVKSRYFDRGPTAARRVVAVAAAVLVAASMSSCSSDDNGAGQPTDTVSTDGTVSPTPDQTPEETATPTPDPCVVGTWSWPQGFSEFYTDGTGDVMPLVDWEAKVTFTWETTGDHMEVVAVDNSIGIPVEYSGSYTCSDAEMYMGNTMFSRVTGGPGDF